MSLNLIKDYEVTAIHVDVNIVHNDVLDLDAFRQWNPEYANAELCWKMENMFAAGLLKKCPSRCSMW